MTASPGRFDRQAAALGNLDLELDKIKAGDCFRDRVLGGKKWFAFEIRKIATGRQQKSNRCGALIADLSRQLYGRLCHSRPHLAIERRRGAFAQKRPAISRHGRVSLEKVDRVAMLVAENLKLDQASVRIPPIGGDGYSESLGHLFGIQDCPKMLRGGANESQA